MDWRNYQFWRKDIRRVDETTAEFNLLVQRTKQRITLTERIGESIRLFQGTSEDSQSISRRESISRKLSGLRKNIPFLRKF